MTDDDVKRLRELARAATPGPWVGPLISDRWPPGWIAVCEGYTDAPGEHVPGAYFVTTGHAMTARADNGKPEPSQTRGQDEANAAYIAATSPDVLLALLDERDRAWRAAEAAHKVKAALLDERDAAMALLREARDFIDTTRDPAYPAGAGLADRIDALLGDDALRWPRDDRGTPT